MDTEEIADGNKLIAEFMGAEFRENYAAWKFYYMEDAPFFNLSRMKYHSSWDWLMPVVEKIEQLGYSVRFDYIYDSASGFGGKFDDKPTMSYNENRFVVSIDSSGNYDDEKSMITEEGVERIENDITVNAFSKKEIIWCAVVKFIKWHNEQKGK